MALIGLVAMVAPSSTSAQTTSACPGLPLEKEVVDNDPMYENICSTIPPCTTPIQPVVLTDQADDFVRSQGLVVEAEVPDGFVADMISWKAEFVDPNGVPLPLWTYETSAGIRLDGSGNPEPGPYTVTLGAPGLMVDSNHRFRVSFRRDSDMFWLCWSIRSAAAATTPFSTFGPKPPLTAQIEDHFRRPATAIKNDGGDGMGPGAVWNDSPTSAHIASDGQQGAEKFSVFVDNGGGRYVQESFHPHTYVEGLFRRDVPGSYNIDLFAKYHEPQPMTANYYFLKLAHGWRGCDDTPTMFLVRALEEGPITTCDDAPGDPPNPNLPSDAAMALGSGSGQPKCNEFPPLDDEDAGDTFSPKRSKPVWLRIEVDRNAAGRAIITGSVAWNCTDDQVIENCSNLCTPTRTDFVDTNMVLVEGQWGFFFHDTKGSLDHFRAGSDPFN